MHLPETLTLFNGDFNAPLKWLDTTSRSGKFMMNEVKNFLIE